MTMSHRKAQKAIHAAADGMLRAEELRELQRHLAKCAECQTYSAELAHLEASLRRSLQARWPSSRQSDGAVQRGIAQVQSRLGKQNWLQRVYDSASAVAWASLIIALVILVVWSFRSISPQLSATPGQTSTPSATQDALFEQPEPTAQVKAGKERALTICMGAEPDSLYLYGSSMLVSKHVHEAIYDGPIDQRNFGYQPVILETLPSLANGGAITETVNVHAGELVVDDTGEPATLVEGMRVRPAGCHSAECAVDFDGDALEMERLTATFTLKPSIQWSDGEPVTAYDSVYAFELDRDADTPTDKRLIQRTASYKALDDFSTVWTGLPGYLDAAYMTHFWTPMPEHAWGSLTALELIEAQESARTPLGWGPYIVDEWAPGERIVLTRNENYWRADEGLPRFDTVVFRFVGEEPNATIAALLAGECDIADQSTQLEGQSGMLQELQAVGKLNATFVTGTVWEHVDFGIEPVDGYERPDFFGDVRVRQAIAHCLDREAVVEAVMHGQTQVLGTYVPPEHPLYNPDVQRYPFDPELGTALLEAVGWIEDDGDLETPRVAQGVPNVPDGTPFSFGLWSTDAGQRQAVTRVLQASLAQCGIEANLEYWNPSELFSGGPDGPLFGRRFDMAQFAWLTGVEPPCELFSTEQITGDPDAGFCGWDCTNHTGFSNRAYDAACSAALQSLPGTPEHARNHHEAQRIFAEQMPVVPLYLRLKLAATRPDLTNFIMDPTVESEFWNIEAFDYKE